MENNVLTLLAGAMSDPDPAVTHFQEEIRQYTTQMRFVLELPRKQFYLTGKGLRRAGEGSSRT